MKYSLLPLKNLILYCSRGTFPQKSGNGVLQITGFVCLVINTRPWRHISAILSYRLHSQRCDAISPLKCPLPPSWISGRRSLPPPPPQSSHQHLLPSKQRPDASNRGFRKAYDTRPMMISPNHLFSDEDKGGNCIIEMCIDKTAKRRVTRRKLKINLTELVFLMSRHYTRITVMYLKRKTNNNLGR